jgi:phosphomannomutase
MVKTKRPLAAEPDWEAAQTALGGALQEAEFDHRDGLRAAGRGEWVHLRKSGTEPIIRVIAEASSLERARSLVEVASASLA